MFARQSVGRTVHGPGVKLLVKVKNIGSADFKGSFWLSTSSTEESFEKKQCFGGSRVNYGKNQKTIRPGETFEIERERSFDEELSKITVFVNMQSICSPDPGYRDIKEANYDNNAFVVDIDWENREQGY